MHKSLRPIAIYLPQFHPIPENDAWWGKGFTEWTNVTKAKPLFEGHYQPQLPADFGFYDLRVPETMQSQAEAAAHAGLKGFMFYHYWFNGRRILNAPIDNYRYKVKSDFPYFLCWANENWTRRWDGEEKDVLLEQKYNAEDDIAHLEFLKRFFDDPRYIRVDDKPVLAVYKTELMPDPKSTALRWRDLASKIGLKGLYLIRVEAMDWTTLPESIGFDASLQFQPDWRRIGQHRRPFTPGDRFRTTLHNNPITRRLYRLFDKKGPFKSSNAVIDYKSFSEEFQQHVSINYKRFPGITPSWDNYSRRQKGNAVIFHNSSPSLYEKWLSYIVDSFLPYSTDENFIFINAWNEWAEGNHLEPCIKWERGYLEATERVLSPNKK